MKFDAILFDFDGTLVDSEPIHYECWQAVLKPFGVSLSWEEYCRNCIGVSDRKMIQNLSAEVGVEFDALYAQYPVKKEMLRDKMLANPHMPATTRDLFRELQGWRIGLVTSSFRLEVEPVLQTLHLDKHFETMVFGDQVANLKPHPEPYLEAARRMGVSNPLVFEDSNAGLTSARAAGFEAIHVAKAEDLAGLLRARLLN
ncbi:HAD family hydrolase [Bryobacter aggregatus]|uniref:HAD family hydrolase n=1 Tax=Bryobacter aggregatus TaxID=360054 RepID=UPI0004E0EE7F|nr:HAD family phosphatase [Bryobacter aggregatus]